MVYRNRENIMNYNQSYIVKEVFEAKGYNVELSASASSDYAKITNPADKYGFKLVVRFSDHDAMTGRSACADLDYNMTSLLTKWGEKFESGLIVDASGDYDYEVTEFDTENERNNAFMEGVIAEIVYKLDF